MTSPGERFLQDWHAQHAGATRVALGGVPVRCEGRPFDSSYHVLAADAPAGAGELLDLACGDGHLLALLAEASPAATLTGVDMSAAELAAASARLGARAELVAARAQQLPFAEGRFDALFSHMALMLMDDAPAVLAEVRRVLRPGGALSAVVGAGLPASPLLASYQAILKPLLAESPRRVAFGDARWRSDDGIRALLQAAGFGGIDVAPIEGELALPPTAMWEWFSLMYDPALLSPPAREQLRRSFLAEAGAQAGAGGMVHLPLAWKRVRARRA